MQFAALIHVAKSVQEKGLYWLNNVIGSFSLVQASVEHGYGNFGSVLLAPLTVTKTWWFWIKTVRSIRLMPMDS